MTQDTAELALRAAQAIREELDTRQRDAIVNDLLAPIIQRIFEPALKAAEAREVALRGELRFIREALWLGHGHDGLYGDDGEMQCGRVGQHGDVRGPVDFKRDPPPRLWDAFVGATRAERDSALLVLRRIGEALELTQQIVMGSFAKGWTIHVTGHQMDSIRAAISEARAAVKEK